MDSMSTCVQSTPSAHGLHEHSMSTRCAVHEESMDFMAVFPTVYMESMSTLHGVHRHFQKYSGLHGQCSNSVSWTPWTIFCGLLVDFRRLLMDFRRLLMDSP